MTDVQFGLLFGALVLIFILAFILLSMDVAKRRPIMSKSSEEACTDDQQTKPKFGITRFFFILVNICAIIWVFISYGIAIYSTVVLGQTYTMSELSEPAINTILGVTIMKVVENIFEHNEGWLFGYQKGESKDA